MKLLLLFGLLCNVWGKNEASPTILNDPPRPEPPTHDVASPVILNDPPRPEPPTHEPNSEALNRDFTDNGEELHEGDMILTSEQFDFIYGPLDTRKAIDDLRKRWTDAVVPYAISASSEQDREVILSGLQHWMDNTCVSFVEVEEDAAEPHLIFKKLKGCYSSVGMQNKNGQDVSIGKNCESMGTVAHEVGHALGFYHEQSRPDRDQFVKLLDHNINVSHAHNFNLQNNINNYGVPYDLGSLMHYGLDYFSINKRNTMVPKDIHRNYEIGQRKGLSFYDIKLATLMYNCAAQCTSKPSCQNGGFVDFSCKCRCPPNHTGNQCQTKTQVADPICGGDIVVDPTTIKTPNYPNKYPKDVKCIWVIKAPAGQRVKVSFRNFELIHYNPGDPVCHWDHLEVRANDIYEGDKYCATDLQGKEIISASNEMALLFRTQYDMNKGFEADITFEWVWK